MESINFRKHPFRRIFTEIAEEQSRQRGKLVSAGAIRLAYHRNQPETVSLVTAKIQQRLSLSDAHVYTIESAYKRQYF